MTARTALTPSSPQGPDMVLNLDSHRRFMTESFEKLFHTLLGDRPVPYSLSAQDYGELTAVCNAAVAPLHRTVSDRRWMSYFDVVTTCQSRRHVQDHRALMGACALCAVGFAWDDMEPTAHNLDDILPEIGAISNRYFTGDDAVHAYDGARVFMVSDGLLRNSPIERKLCRTSLEQYFRYRVVDAGNDFWMKISYPIYRSELFTEHALSGLAAQLITRSNVVVNDAYSFPRERELGEIANCFYLCPVDDEGFRDFFDLLLNGIAEDIDCIKTFDRVTCEILSDLIYGNFLWSTNSCRYEAARNEVNQRIG